MGLFDDFDSRTRQQRRAEKRIRDESEDRIDDFTEALSTLDVDMNEEECDESANSSARMANFHRHATAGLADVLAEAGRAEARAKGQSGGE